MTTTADFRDTWISPRTKIAALWATMMFAFAYVDLFSLYRADVRADIEAGEVGGVTIGQSFLLGSTAYVLVPALMVSLSLLLPVRVSRIANVVLAAIYLATIVAGAVGEWSYYLVGSAVEVAALSAIVHQAWTWPKHASGPQPSAPGHGASAVR